MAHVCTASSAARAMCVLLHVTVRATYSCFLLAALLWWCWLSGATAGCCSNCAESATDNATLQCQGFCTDSTCRTCCSAHAHCQLDSLVGLCGLATILRYNQFLQQHSRTFLTYVALSSKQPWIIALVVVFCSRHPKTFLHPAWIVAGGGGQQPACRQHQH